MMMQQSMNRRIALSAICVLSLIIILQGCAVDPASPTNDDVGGKIPTSEDIDE